jgi:hypothetical protein
MIELVRLGDRVKDTVSGLIGIVVAKTEWLNGCWRIAVQQKVTKDGKLPDLCNFDIEQLIVIKNKASKISQKETGGDRPDVTKRIDPVRQQIWWQWQKQQKL